MLHRRLIRSLAAAVAAAALLAPSAAARPDYPVGPATAGAGDRPAAVETVGVPRPAVIVEAEGSSGFDWGSAGIGAGVAAALVLLAGVTASATVHHRRAAAR